MAAEAGEAVQDVGDEAHGNAAVEVAREEQTYDAPNDEPLRASLRSTNMRARGGTKTRKFTSYVGKPRGAPGGPLRTPLHIGDSWQHQEAFEVEKVVCGPTRPTYG